MVTLAMVSGLGGGIIRDILLGALPPATFTDWRYPAVDAACGVAAFACGNGCGTGGQQVVDPSRVHVHAAGHRPGDICLGDHADRPVARLGTEYHQGGRPSMFHQVGGRSDVVIFPHRRR